MARELTPAYQETTEARVKSPILFVELSFDSGPIRFWTGYGLIVWDGKTWSGAGGLGEISSIEEAVEIASKGVTLSMNGLPSDIVAASLTENYQNRPVRLWLANMGEDGLITEDPYLMLAGLMNQIEDQDDGNTASMSLTVENRLVDLSRSRERRLTDEDQKTDFPDDKGFEFVNALQNKQLLWGNAAAGSSGLPVPPSYDGGGGGVGQDRFS